MLLATTKVADLDRFIAIFSPRAPTSAACTAEGRIFRDPSEADRVWVIFDWDAEGWKNFVSDPEVPAIPGAGHAGKLQAAMLQARYDA